MFKKNDYVGFTTWPDALNVQIKKLHQDAKIPTKNIGDAGYDIYSIEDISIPAGQKIIIKTGIAMAVPSGYVALLWDRSGMSAKYGIHRLAGVIDSTYRGEWLVALVNLTDVDYEVKAGDRIIQCLFQRYEECVFVEVDELPDSIRGDGKMGSSGK